MEAIGYIRVSTPGQVADGVSLDAQRAKIEAWAVVNDAELIEIHEDAGISGKATNGREGLLSALQDAKRHGCALVVYSLSRLSRSTRDTLAIADELDRAGADLVSLSEKIDTTSAAGKMVFRMLAVLNEFERDQISERTKAAMAHLRDQGRRISGRIPFGFQLADDGRNLIKDPREQRAMKLMVSLRADGVTMREICAELERRGIPTKSGRPWAIGTVHGILKKVAA